jgi:hypothetical protein
MSTDTETFAPYRHRKIQPTMATSLTEILDSPRYDEIRDWFSEHLGVDIETVRYAPGFWIGMSVGSTFERMASDVGI